MTDEVFQVALDCKANGCKGQVIYEEFDSRHDAEVRLRSHRKLTLECGTCRRSYQYSPADDNAYVQPKPSDQERLQIF